LSCLPKRQKQPIIRFICNTANAKILYAYQQVNGAPGTNKWVRWPVYQYDSGKAWDEMGASLGEVFSGNEYFRDSLTYTDGSGDGGTWTNYTGYGGDFKKRVAAVGYTAYSAYASYTVQANSNNLYLSYLSVNGICNYFRVKVNGVASTTGYDLDSNGEYNGNIPALAGTPVINYIHITSNVVAGDMITIEVKQYDAGGKNNVYIYSIVEGGGSVNPGDSNWFYVGRLIQSTVSADTVAISLGGGVFFGGPAHPGHEYNPNLTLALDGSPITLGTSIIKGQVLNGQTLSAVAADTVFKTAQGVDDFGTLTKSFTWSGSQLVRGWQLDFTGDASFAIVYMNSHSFSNTPTYNTNNVIFRYASLGTTNPNILLPVDNSSIGVNIGPSSIQDNSFTFFGGNLGLKMTQTSSNAPTKIFMGSTTQKIYQQNDAWAKTWQSGNSIDNTTTIILAYEAPASHDWSGKTLYVPKSQTITLSAGNIPFNGHKTIVKSIASKGLNFSGVSPSDTYFTSRNDDVLGIQEYTSNHTPAKGDWAGITVNGAVNAASNIVTYATTGTTLTGNANAYNNSFNQNTTGINAAAGSTVRNNALTNQTTYTSGAGSFDYNCYSDNAEAHGVNGNPAFTDAAGGDFSLTSISSAIDAGYDTSIATDYVGKQRYDDPDVPNTGGGAIDYYDIGAYEYVTPPTPVLASLTNPSQTIWYFFDTPEIHLTNNTSSTTHYHYLVDQNQTPNIADVAAGTQDSDGVFTVPEGVITDGGVWYVHLVAQNLDNDNSTNYGTYKIMYSLHSSNPSVIIESVNLAENQVVHGTYRIEVSARTIKGGIKYVEFYIDNVLVGTDYDAPYFYDWDTAQYHSPHTVRIVVYDSKGSKSEVSYDVFVLNELPGGSTNELLYGSTNELPYTGI